MRARGLKWSRKQQNLIFEAKRAACAKKYVFWLLFNEEQVFSDRDMDYRPGNVFGNFLKVFGKSLAT